MSEKDESRISTVNIINNYNNQSATELNTNFLLLEKLEERARNKLIKRYEQPTWFYNEKVINDILFNEKTHYVEMFKEYLLYEDYNEFLRQYYAKPLLTIKLQKILDFYEKYSKIFPNYTALRESKYLYKNIKRKQKVINQINENKRNENIEDDSDASYKVTIFNSRVINSIYTGHNTINVNKNNDTLLTNDKSISNFIEQISALEKESNKIKEQKNKFKEVKINKNPKKSGQIIIKRLSNILINSQNYNHNHNIKNKEKNDNKKNIIEKHLNINNKIVSNPYNYISKQKSLSNLIYPNKKINSSFKFDNNNKFSRKNMSNINNNSLLGKTNGLKYYLDYEKYKKILISTNIAHTPKIIKERMLSSPKRIKNIKFVKKRCLSNSKVNNNTNINRNMSNTNAFNSKNSKIKNKNNKNELKEEKKLLKYQLNNQNKNKLLNNYYTESINKCYSNDISSLSEKRKNMRKNNTINNKNKIVNNFNITNGIMNNSTQINIYTGNNLIKSLNLYWNSIINSTKPNSPIYEKQIGTKTISKKMKKMKNMKQFFIKQMKEKKVIKEPHTERNSSNEKLLKLLDIYCSKTKKHRNTNIKKNKNILNRSNNYKTKSKTKFEEKSLQDFIYKNSNFNIDKFKDKDTNNYINSKKNLIKNNRIVFDQK